MRSPDEYRTIFSGRDRLAMRCPDCKQGCNSPGLGGTATCFHCDNCGLIECAETSPSRSISEDNG